jgi:hypothetical protein
MTVRETAENIAKTIDSMAEEIAKRSVPSSDESFREWSSHRLHERIKTHACSVILDYLLGDFQRLAGSRVTRNDEPRQASAPASAAATWNSLHRLRHLESTFHADTALNAAIRRQSNW